MSGCQHDPKCPGYGPTHHRLMGDTREPPPDAAVSVARRKRMARAIRKQERAWYGAQR